MERQDITRLIQAISTKEYKNAQEALQAVITKKLIKRIRANIKEEYDSEARYGTQDDDFEFDTPKDERTLDDITLGTENSRRTSRINAQNPLLHKKKQTLNALRSQVEKLGKNANTDTIVELFASYGLSDASRDPDAPRIAGTIANGNPYENAISFIERELYSIDSKLGLNNDE